MRSRVESQIKSARDGLSALPLEASKTFPGLPKLSNSLYDSPSENAAEFHRSLGIADVDSVNVKHASHRSSNDSSSKKLSASKAKRQSNIGNSINNGSGIQFQDPTAGSNIRVKASSRRKEADVEFSSVKAVLFAPDWDSANSLGTIAGHVNVATDVQFSKRPHRISGSNNRNSLPIPYKQSDSSDSDTIVPDLDQLVPNGQLNAINLKTSSSSARSKRDGIIMNTTPPHSAPLESLEGKDGLSRRQNVYSSGLQASNLSNGIVAKDKKSLASIEFFIPSDKPTIIGSTKEPSSNRGEKNNNGMERNHIPHYYSSPPVVRQKYSKLGISSTSGVSAKNSNHSTTHGSLPLSIITKLEIDVEEELPGDDDRNRSFAPTANTLEKEFRSTLQVLPSANQTSHVQNTENANMSNINGSNLKQRFAMTFPSREAHPNEFEADAVESSVKGSKSEAVVRTINDILNSRVIDETKAHKNDTIVQALLLQAKAMNSKSSYSTGSMMGSIDQGQVAGSVMHEFSLWSNVTKRDPLISATSESQPQLFAPKNPFSRNHVSVPSSAIHKTIRKETFVENLNDLSNSKLCDANSQSLGQPCTLDNSQEFDQNLSSYSDFNPIDQSFDFGPPKQINEIDGNNEAVTERSECTTNGFIIDEESEISVDVGEHSDIDSVVEKIEDMSLTVMNSSNHVLKDGNNDSFISVVSDIDDDSSPIPQALQAGNLLNDRDTMDPIKYIGGTMDYLPMTQFSAQGHASNKSSKFPTSDTSFSATGKLSQESSFRSTTHMMPNVTKAKSIYPHNDILLNMMLMSLDANGTQLGNKNMDRVSLSDGTKNRLRSTSSPFIPIRSFQVDNHDADGEANPVEDDANINGDESPTLSVMTSISDITSDNRHFESSSEFEKIVFSGNDNSYNDVPILRSVKPTMSNPFCSYSFRRNIEYGDRNSSLVTAAAAYENYNKDLESNASKNNTRCNEKLTSVPVMQVNSVSRDAPVILAANDSSVLLLYTGCDGQSPLRWKRGMPIGEGTFGRVYKGLNEKTGELLAVKQLGIADGTEKEVHHLQKEISVMWNLEHEHIVRYLGTAQTDRFLYIILEFIPGGSIASMLSQFGAFSDNLIRKFTCHILLGLEYLHNKGIIHRDIKGANVLVTDTGIAKIADFGCSKQLAGLFTASMEESMHTIRGSTYWMAPEVIKQSGYGRSSDIWSVGATIIEMATTKPPWVEFNNNLAALFHVASCTEPPEVSSTINLRCGALIKKCMAIDPQLRPNATELLTTDIFLITE